MKTPSWSTSFSNNPPSSFNWSRTDRPPPAPNFWAFDRAAKGNEAVGSSGTVGSSSTSNCTWLRSVGIGASKNATVLAPSSFLRVGDEGALGWMVGLCCCFWGRDGMSNRNLGGYKQETCYVFVVLSCTRPFLRVDFYLTQFLCQSCLVNTENLGDSTFVSKPWLPGRSWNMNHNLNHQQIPAQSVLGKGIVVVVLILMFMENSLYMMQNSMQQKSNPNMFSWN